MAKIFAAGLPGCSAYATALACVSLDVRAGDAVVIAGAAGSGKTTLLLCAAGLLVPDAGDVLWRDSPARATPMGGLVRYVAPRLGAHVLVTVEEALLYHALRHDATLHARTLASVPELIAALDLRSMLRTPVDLLPTRERYRVAIAESLVLGAQVLALDDPPDDAVAAMLLSALRSRGLGLIAVNAGASLLASATHSLALVGGRVRSEPPRVHRVAEDCA
ncbi:MAG: ATP-binding cassette domain-containing protein [Gemmatimonadaceae bacterium]